MYGALSMCSGRNSCCMVPWLSRIQGKISLIDAGGVLVQGQIWRPDKNNPKCALATIATGLN